MAKRRSHKPVTPATTLRFVVIAIRRAGGAAGEPHDSRMETYENTLGAAIGAQLSTLQLGIFAANQPLLFKEFYKRFSEELDDLLHSEKVNWVGDENPSDGTPEALQKCLNKWKIDTTLGTMAVDLVNEFDDKIEYVDPAPIF